MSLYDWIKKRDKQLADKVAGSDLYFHLSPTRSSLFQTLKPLLPQYLKGDCLDAGAGRMAYKHVLLKHVNSLTSMDVTPKPGLDAVGSVLDLPWQDSSFDSIFCSQVLEHVPDPERAMRELFRVLKPGRYAVISVPHLAYLHNEPHDYCRFTHYGLRAFLGRSGFEVLEITPAGGLPAFLGHIPSVLLKAPLAAIPGIGWLALRLNIAYSKLVVAVDRHVEKKKIYALNYIAIARKPENG